MSEYWKSTPKYWCKFCKTYVRDTTLEKKQHEATGRHQGNIQKSLRELHKTQGREERDKQRAKDEIARLDGLVPGKDTAKASSSSATPQSVAKAKPHFTRPAPKQASADDRKRQAEQLGAMGIAVPDEFRKDLSIAGEWSTVSSTPVYARPPPEIKHGDSDGEEYGDSKFKVSAFGQSKRRLDDEDGEAEATARSKRTWGSTLKSYPATGGRGADEFDALLSAKPIKPEVKPEPEELESGVMLKKEDSTDVVGSSLLAGGADGAGIVDAPVVFKKRKAKR